MIDGWKAFTAGYLVSLAACIMAVAIDRFWHTDSEFYWIHAEGILEGTLWFPYNPWGYSVLLVPFVWLGLSPAAALLMLHPLAAGGCSMLLASLCRDHGPGSVNLAVLLLLGHLGFQAMSAMLLPDLWTALLLLLTATALKNGQGLMAGGWLGLGAWLRSTGLTAAIVVSLAALLWQRKLVPPLLIGFTAAVLLVSVWASSLTGRPMFISDQGGLGHHWKPVPGGFVETEDEERERRGELGYLGFARQDPAAFIQERYYTAMNLFFPWPLGEDRSLWHKLAIAYPEALLWLLAICALLSSRGRSLLWRSWPLWATALGAAAVHLAFHSQVRHRTMWAPLWIALLTPAALVTLVRLRSLSPNASR